MPQCLIQTAAPVLLKPRVMQVERVYRTEQRKERKTNEIMRSVFISFKRLSVSACTYIPVIYLVHKQLAAASEAAISAGNCVHTIFVLWCRLVFGHWLKMHINCVCLIMNRLHSIVASPLS